jgi:hypothetical protein
MLLLIAWTVSTGPALCDDGDQYFVSMRAPLVDPAPRFVGAAQSATDTQTAPLSGCDGETYYLAPNDLAVVTAALASGNTVQLQVASAGAPPDGSAIVCLWQASS